METVIIKKKNIFPIGFQFWPEEWEVEELFLDQIYALFEQFKKVFKLEMIEVVIWF